MIAITSMVLAHASVEIPGLDLINSSNVKLTLGFEAVVDSSHGIRIVGSRPRTQADGSIQHIVSADVIVPGPTQFILDEDGSTDLTNVAIYYSGIARDRHVATLEIVAAVTRDGITTIAEPDMIRIRFAPLPEQRDRATEQTTSIGAVNEWVPWR
ncbi:MAG: hypothetical protein EHM43_04785, partial [Ignavibacteriae bacterium]